VHYAEPPKGNIGFHSPPARRPPRPSPPFSQRQVIFASHLFLVTTILSLIVVLENGINLVTLSTECMSVASFLSWVALYPSLAVLYDTFLRLQIRYGVIDKCHVCNFHSDGELELCESVAGSSLSTTPREELSADGCELVVE